MADEISTLVSLLEVEKNINTKLDKNSNFYKLKYQSYKSKLQLEQNKLKNLND